jgi:hypothetical protein
MSTKPPDEDTQSSEPTAKKRVIGRPFKKGQSGHPGGRPKGLGTTIRAAFGEDPEGLVQFAKDIIEGKPIPGPMARKVKLSGAIKATDQLWIVAKVEERIQMWKLITEQGWGKPQQNLNIQSQTLNASVDLSKLTDAQLESLEQILAQAATTPEEPGGEVEGEATEAAALPAPAPTERIPESESVAASHLTANDPGHPRYAAPAERIPEPAPAAPVTQEPHSP